MTKTVALLPCPNPWCPSQPKAESYFDDGGYFYRVRCVACGIIGPDGNCKAEAIAAWNTRTQTDQQLREEVERLRRVLEHTADGLSFDIDRMDAKGMGTLNIKDMQSIARDAAAAAIARMGV